MKTGKSICTTCVKTSRQVAALMEAVTQLSAKVEAQAQAKLGSAEQSLQSVGMPAERSLQSEPGNALVATGDVIKARAESAQWVVVAGQRVGKHQLLDLHRDAARYRWLRDKAADMLGTAAPMVANLDASGRMTALIDGDDLDAAVDIMMAQQAGRKPQTKRTGTE